MTEVLPLRKSFQTKIVLYRLMPFHTILNKCMKLARKWDYVSHSNLISKLMILSGIWVECLSSWPLTSPAFGFTGCLLWWLSDFHQISCRWNQIQINYKSTHCKAWQVSQFGYTFLFVSPRKLVLFGRRVHISEKTLQCLNGEFEIEPAFGEKREETLRIAGLKTYFIKKVLIPVCWIANPILLIEFYRRESWNKWNKLI